MKRPEDIDTGFKIYEPDLWALDLPIEEVLIADIANNLDTPYLEKEGTDDWNLSINMLISNFDAEKTHAGKVFDADLSYPIELYFFKDQWIILDGVHRLAKAVHEGQDNISVRRVPQFEIDKLLEKVENAKD